MRNLPMGGSRDMVPEEMETNADGINTSRDAPAEVKGTLSLWTEFSCHYQGESAVVERLTLLRLRHAQIHENTN